MFTVKTNSLREVGPRDRDGATSFAVGETTTTVYEGTDARAAVAALELLGVGVSVEVTYPGHVRSCMNKPALWSDILESAE